MSIGIAYVDGPRLARSMSAAAECVAECREELNRLNVFPVPDGDTGTNLSLTLRSVVDALRALGDAPLGQTANTMARAAVLGARGNSGLMLAHFLLGFAEAIDDRDQVTAGEVAAALRRGSDTLYDSLDNPREGTILTVARDAAAAAERAARDTDDIGEFMHRLHAEGKEALARTPELLAVLRDAGVVDAGGKGFVRMLEGVVRLIDGDPILPTDLAPGVGSDPGPAAIANVAAERDYQFCTEVLVRGDQLPSANEARSAMHGFGGSVVVAQIGDLLKVHVHTDDPTGVFAHAARWGTIAEQKADDMRAQHAALRHPRRRAVTVVVDSSADLADTVLDQHHISMVPLQITFGEQTYLDRLELKPDEFYRRLRTTRENPTTSQPTPADFVRVLRSASDEAESVIAIVVSSGLSGTHAAARTAVRMAGLDRVHVVDSRSASFGLGLAALRAAELAESGWSADAIVKELERMRLRSGLLLTVDRYENLLRSGRVSKGRAWLAGMLDVKPILSLDRDGRLVPVDRVRGRDQLVGRVLQLLDSALKPRPERVRFGVAHADAPDVAERVRAALVAAYQPQDCFVSPATGVLGAHVGPGAWALAYQVEDGADHG